MIAAIYARKSTEQSGVSTEEKSVTRQIEHARTYAEARGWTVSDAHIYVDDGISGAEFANRPGFLRLMNALKPRPPFQVLVMSEESRLGREAIETAYALKQIVTAGVRVFFYLADQERTLESPTDKLLMSVTAFADELEREKTRQRVYDAMSRKARQGYVTGGRVFGYENVEVLGPDGKRSHVERRVLESEAMVVRRIFELCGHGAGLTRITKTLNDEGAVAPRSQQGRPRAWAPSSVREVLYRPLYRGEVVWNKTKKRDAWGQARVSDRPAEAWLRRERPELRIVSEAAWQAAHAQLTVRQGKFFRDGQGRLYARSRDAESPYLLSGFCRCGACGGGFSVVTRSHGKRRAPFYACTSYHKRGSVVCRNGRVVPMDAVDQALLHVFEEIVLRPDTVQAVLERCVAALAPEALQQAEAALSAQIAQLDTELARLAEAIAAGGDVPSLVEALKQRQAKRGELETARAELAQRVVRIDRSAVAAKVEKRLQDWQGLLKRQVPAGRQLFRKLLQGPIVFTPLETGRGYAFRGTINYGRLFSGAIPLPTSVASLTGFEPVLPP